MRYVKRVSTVQVIGSIWMPNCQAAMSYTLRDYDLENILARGGGQYSRDAVEDWLGCNSRDFQSVADFRADISDKHGTDFVSDWADPDSEMTYQDCMDGGVDE